LKDFCQDLGRAQVEIIDKPAFYQHGVVQFPSSWRLELGVRAEGFEENSRHHLQLGIFRHLHQPAGKFLDFPDYLLGVWVQGHGFDGLEIHFTSSISFS
jgi:hypothetical protein